MALPSLNDLLVMLHEMSGMKVSVLAVSLRTITTYPNAISGFCREIHQCKSCQYICYKSDIDAIAHVAETKAVYSYTCPFGLQEIIAPIIINDKIVAYILLGQIIEQSENKEENALKMALKYHPDAEQRFETLISEQAHLTPVQIQGYCKLLEVLTRYIEQNQLCLSQDNTLGNQIKYYIKNNFQNQINLEDIAFSLHCSKMTITKIFRKEFGMTIMQYVRIKRLDHSRVLLMDPSLTIKEIASKCGFPDSGYFTKSFIQMHGTSPTEWRKEHLNQPNLALKPDK